MAPGWRPQTVDVSEEVKLVVKKDEDGDGGVSARPLALKTTTIKQSGSDNEADQDDDAASRRTPKRGGSGGGSGGGGGEGGEDDEVDYDEQVDDDVAEDPQETRVGAASRPARRARQAHCPPPRRATPRRATVWTTARPTASPAAARRDPACPRLGGRC